MKKFLYIILGLTISIPFGYSQTINPLSFLSRVSSTDKTPGYLLSKFVAGSGVILTQNNTGGNESITISASSTGGGGSLSGGVAKWLAYWTSSTTLSAVATGTVGSFLTASTSASGYDWTASSTVSSLLNYWTKSSNNLYYTAGNIGVGTTTPGYPLTVVGTSSLATTTGVFWDMGGQVYNVKSYGAKCDGVTDDTTAINATIAAAASSTGGVILFPIGRCLQNGAVIIPYTGASPTQVPLRFTGLGQTNNGYWASSPINGGSIWDLRYDGTDGLHPAKIDTRGAGTLEIDHLTIASGGTDNFLIMQTTNTTVFVHENAIIGNPNNTGDGNLQDFLQMGSTTATIGSGAGAPFQGYGSVVSKNYYSHIRTGIRFGNFANGIEVDNETYSTTCGSSNASSSPYYFAPGAIGSNGGNRINGSTIEMTHYSYMTVVEGNSTYNRFNDMGGYDQGSHTAGGFYFSSDAVINRVLIGYWENNHPIVSGAGSAHTTIIGSAPGEPSYFPDGISGDGIPAVNQVNTWTASQHFAWQSTIFGQGNSSSTKNYILLGDLDDNNNVWLQALSVSNPDIGIKMMTKGNGAFEIVNGNLYVSSTTANSLFGGNLKVNGEISNANGDLKLQNMTTYQLIQSYNSKPLVLNQFGNNIGIGSTTTPSQPLTVIGNQYLGGALFDGSNASGTNGMILQSTGTGIRWVATSSAIAAYTGTYPIIVNGSTISSGFSTSTVNNFTAQNTFTTASSTGFTANTLYSTLANLINASTTGLSASLLFVSSTSTLATTTISGNLGIGTLVPQQKLHVNSGVTYQGILINGNAAPNVGFASNAGLTPIWKVGLSGNVGTNLSISSGAANTDVMSFSGSNVGIGTTTPGSKLTVQGNTLLQGTGVLNPLTIASSTGTTLFQVLANGNVGVGSSSPSSLLTVVSTSSMRAILPETTLTYDLGASTSRWNSGWINTLNLGTSTFSIGQPTTNRLGFFTLAEKAGTEALSIFTDGKVGIGSTSPSDLLTVQGSINVTGSVKVNGVPLSAGSGLTSLNGQTGSTQTFATTTTGTDFSVTSSGDVHTFAMPSASLTARGLVNTIAQSFAGIKTFTDIITTRATTTNLTISGLSNTFLAVNSSGQVIATTTPTSSSASSASTTIVDFLVQKNGANTEVWNMASSTLATSTTNSSNAIQYAIDQLDASTGRGGTIKIGRGTYSLPTVLTVEGNQTIDSPQVIILGDGIQSTILAPSAGVDAIKFTQRAKFELKQLSFQISSTSNAIVTTNSSSGQRATWLSNIEQIYIEGAANHTGRGMDLDNFFRGTVRNIDMNQVGNGIRLTAIDSSTNYNPGDSIFERIFIELNTQSNTKAIELVSNLTGTVNQLSFDMVEGISAGATGQKFIACTGSLGCNWNSFRNLNAEGFRNIVDISAGNYNDFTFNYTITENSATSTYFKFASGARLNRVTAKNVDTNAQNVVIWDDANSTTGQGNTLENTKITGSALSISYATTTASILKAVLDDAVGTQTYLDTSDAQLKNPGENRLLYWNNALSKMDWIATSSLGISGGSLSGGTNGLLALWSSATTLVTSLFMDNGTVTGIGATSSTERFNVASTTGNTMFSVGVNGQLSIATTTAATTTLTDISLPSLVQKWFSATVLPGLEKLFVTQASSTPASFAFDEMSVARSRITPGSGTTYNLDNVGAVTSGCTVLKLAPSAVLNAIFASYRIRHSSVVTTPNQICGVFVTNETQFFRGGTNTTQNIGGFNFFARVSIDNWTAGNRLFVGLTASTTPISGTSTLAGVRDTVGFGIHQGSTTLTLMSNDASGNVTETTLTGVPAIQAGMGYDLYLYAAPNSDRISYRVDNASTSQIMTTGVITTDLPTKTTMMRPFAAMSNATNTPANSAQFGIARIIIETRK